MFLREHTIIFNTTRSLVLGNDMGFLKYLFDSIGNIVVAILAMLCLGAGIFPMGWTGNLEDIAGQRAIMIGLGIVLTIYIGYRQNRQSGINY